MLTPRSVVNTAHTGRLWGYRAETVPMNYYRRIPGECERLRGSTNGNFC